MSASTATIIAEMNNGEMEILRKLDARVERLSAWAEETANPVLGELRDSAEITRISYEHQLALTRRAIERLLRSTDRLDRTSERLEHTSDRLDRTLNENTRVLRSVRDSLTGGGDGSPAE